ncbi:aminoglycoside phosphotransferase family protein [Paenibacillus profundus]|uniref:aminoglycoside phosphotransferase family protein n=1 Tax=Paenibacillus profundus TaxID=1173085 RepID=UPI003898DA9D
MDDSYRTFCIKGSGDIPRTYFVIIKNEKELMWLPKLKPCLSLPISSPIAKGEPNVDYPFPWSVNRWIDGDTASHSNISDVNNFACDLALFLIELQTIDTTDAPLAGKHNFYRGGDLFVYHDETEKAFEKLKDELLTDTLKAVWEQGIQSKWTSKNVWIHGDVAPGNLLVKNGALCAVIDFGIMGVGDPSCDYAMAWTFFDKDTRNVFFQTLGTDKGTIDRARGWALWKALITYHDENVEVAANAKYAIGEILDEMDTPDIAS